MPSKKFFFYLCMYKMYLISAEEYINTGVYSLRVQKTGEIWPSIEDVGSGIGVKNIFRLVLKEIHGVLETKNPTKKQIKKCKMTEREIFEKFDNLSKDKLNTRSNKKFYVKNDVMTTVIKRCRGEKNRRKKNRWLQKKVDDSRI